MAKKLSRLDVKPKSAKTSISAKPKISQRSFRRAYREDYYRGVSVPGMSEHLVETFRIFSINYKIFLPLLLLSVVLSVATVGLSGVVDQTSTGIFMVFIFLIIWLVTIFAVRHVMSHNAITFRDALYNSMAPTMSVLVVLGAILIQSLPIVLVVVTYSAAVETGFLATPFYALLFLGFAAVMILLSGYMLTSSIVALVAVTAPGLYPWIALRSAANLMVGQRMKFVIRLIVLLAFFALMWGIFVLPLRTLGASPMIIAAVQTIIFCACVLFSAIYLYLYYRWILDAENMLK